MVELTAARGSTVAGGTVSPMSTAGTSGPISAVLFDMGGVVVELAPLDELLGADMAADDFWPRWLASPTVRRFERGACTIEEFAAGLRSELEVDLDEVDVIDRFRRFPRGLFPGAAAMVDEVRRHTVTGVLSNTNEMHWETQIDAERIAGLFDRHYLSYRLGLVKPDVEIFHRVIADLDRPADTVLFIDDNQINVEGARRAGFLAHRARGVAEARAVLSRYQLLAQPT